MRTGKKIQFRSIQINLRYAHSTSLSWANGLGWYGNSEFVFFELVMKKIDVDQNAEGAQAAGIQCMPTFKVYKNGAECEKMEGASDQGLIDLLDRAKAA